MESLRPSPSEAPTTRRRALAVTLHGFANAWRVLTFLGVVGFGFLAAFAFSTTEQFDYRTMQTIAADHTIGWVYVAVAIAILFQGLWAAALSDAAAELLAPSAENPEA
jgi:hypothetical protein